MQTPDCQQNRNGAILLSCDTITDITLKPILDLHHNKKVDLTVIAKNGAPAVVSKKEDKQENSKKKEDEDQEEEDVYMVTQDKRLIFTEKVSELEFGLNLSNSLLKTSLRAHFEKASILE